MRKALYLLMMVICAAGALSLGIAPGTIEVSADRTEKIYIINNERKDIDVLVYAQGEGAENIVLSDALVRLSSARETEEITARLTLPEAPGRHEVQLVAIEVPEVKSGKTVVAARQAVASRIIMNTPVPGTYAQALLSAGDAGAGEPVHFAVKIRNLGTQGIKSARGRIDIFGPTNEIIATLATDEKGIAPGEMRELVATYQNGLAQGRYFARALVTYDGKEAGAETVFDIGGVLVSIQGVYVDKFRLGEIARFTIVVESKWNDVIPDVFADLVVRDFRGGQLTRFMTAEADLAPGQKEVLEAYWDTDGLSSGVYSATVTAHFLGNSLVKDMALDVKDDAIDIDFSPTGLVLAQEDKSSRTLTFIAMLVIASIIVSIVLMRRKRDR